MSTAQTWLDVVTNNLANASTTGYKKDGVSFDDGLMQALESQGKSIGSIGSGAIVKGYFTDFSAGAQTATGNPLDLAIKTPTGAFAVQAPNGVRYTRDGSFSLNADRQLVDKQGRQVLNTQLQPITIDAGKPVVGEDGVVTVDGRRIDQIGVFAGSFVKEGQNLYTSGNAQLVDAPQIASGSLESSNVNAVEEMVAMIRLNRMFELAQRSVQSQDESTEKLVSSLR